MDLNAILTLLQQYLPAHVITALPFVAPLVVLVVQFGKHTIEAYVPPSAPAHDPLFQALPVIVAFLLLALAWAAPAVFYLVAASVGLGVAGIGSYKVIKPQPTVPPRPAPKGTVPVLPTPPSPSQP